MRLIDADAVESRMHKLYVQPDIRLWQVLNVIAHTPTIDAEPVVHGKFEVQPEEFIPNLRVSPVLCKTCGTVFATINKNAAKAMCCPYCGAKMGEK